jgi:hypothetical protein
MSEIQVEQLDLGGLIAILEAVLAETGDRILPVGFNNPHSYRGDYTDLAFEPTCNERLVEMVAAARRALGATFQGWKGGDYTMTKTTLCWLANQGSGVGETLGALLLSLMLGEPMPATGTKGQPE